ncbi:cysteine--tRNA ligase [Candidatus Pelagibacter sp. RS39]|uniref:cysteine--tRNA ligase n=1 Tax=Candidatus Pelagibacter sp. RS39 TaxID=1977864 RepID=UPI000A1491D6|nr:cysteine--tRNA ligase [Candidatus Pelagibacter sp. RS39]ARJ48007.1 cysteine--tRNA ligase [Candidatus Pelagibacter sp. RS39]
MDIFLTNNLSNKKEHFIPKEKNNVGMYVCGPTVYDDPHIGNARPLVIFDILFKLLKNEFPSVKYVRNITDIDDKIIKSSQEQKISTKELTEKVTSSFFKDCEFLNCENPTHQPKATEHIDLMIEMINDLIKKGFAYENKKHVYFEVKKFSDYGKLSNKNLEDLVAGSRVEISENKKNPEDFVLWKPSNNDEPAWDSPWGKGRPGWHLECSAMSKKFLGNEFDIHGGGIDLIFPHHENEIAQSRCANDTKVFANYWVHNAFITMSNEKMAKSQGNILKIKDFRNKISGQIIRLALMSAHYKQPLDWNDKLLSDCESTLDKWYKMYSSNLKSVKVSDEILKPLYEDLNTPGYIANLHKLYEKANKGENIELFVSACKFIGLMNETSEQWNEFKKKRVSITESEIENMLSLRDKARENKNYKEADRIRDELLDKGVLIEDKDGKTLWKFK